jgi:hypothetical protein
MVSARGYSILVAETHAAGGTVRLAEDKGVGSAVWEPLERLAKGEVRQTFSKLDSQLITYLFIYSVTVTIWHLFFWSIIHYYTILILLSCLTLMNFLCFLLNTLFSLYTHKHKHTLYHTHIYIYCTTHTVLTLGVAEVRSLCEKESRWATRIAQSLARQVSVLLAKLQTEITMCWYVLKLRWCFVK